MQYMAASNKFEVGVIRHCVAGALAEESILGFTSVHCSAVEIKYNTSRAVVGAKVPADLVRLTIFSINLYRGPSIQMKHFHPTPMLL